MRRSHDERNGITFMRLDTIKPRLEAIDLRQRELARQLWQVGRSTDRQDEARTIGIEMSSLSVERERLLKSAARQERALEGYGDRFQD